ncbi:MAG: helix-turn-helix domain-containing protein [Deltaproteobacteria bacterium]|nr:helix-turn-helix domain-containing protein [Deltaproteobacteria bacterium]
MDELLSTTAAALLLGVGPTAIKRWSDDGTLPCVRTAGGHRRFRRADVERLLGSQRVDGEASADGELERWLAAVLSSSDSHEIEGLLLLARARAGAWYRALGVVGQLVRELGRRWEDGRIDVMQEHAASDRLARGLARVSDAILVAPTAPRALLVTVEGDDHTLGLSMAELCLREVGWQTRWAGRATPASEVVAALGRGELALVAASASAFSSDPGRLSTWLGLVGPAAADAGVELVLGGTGAWSDPPAFGVRTRDFAELHAYLAGLSSSLAQRRPRPHG